MVRPADTPNSRLLSKVSTLYYDHEYTQQDIANRLELSRPKVSRLLKQAKNNGIVTITVSYPEGNYVDLESRIEQKYGLNEVIVVEVGQSGTGQNDNLIKSLLGAAAAKHLRRTVSKGDIIGVTWGTTLQTMADNIGALQTDHIHIVQMLGGFGPPEAKAHAMDISRRFSQSLNAKLTLLPSPGIVDTPEIKKVLLTDRRVKSAINLFPKVKKAYVGIGAISTNNILKKENAEISEDVQNEIMSSEAVGDIGLNFFDQDGKNVDTSLQNRFIGMTLEQLKDVDSVIGIAGGNEKFDAIKGALNGGYIHVLITDHSTAKRLAAE